MPGVNDYLPTSKVDNYLSALVSLSSVLSGDEIVHSSPVFDRPVRTGLTLHS
jgi:hypothetical protein